MKKILFAASEALPFASSGGLGDVIGSLPVALAALSEGGEPLYDVRVVMPLYGTIADAHRQKMTFLCHFDVPLAWRRQYAGIFEYKKDGVTFYFIDNEYYFKRESLYGAYDDGERFAFFSRALLEMLPKIGFRPDILHAHDWQSALSVVYLKTKYAGSDFYNRIRAGFTIHNIAFQGIYGFEILGDVFDLDEGERRYVEYDGCINLMKGAIVLCDFLSTVSPTYAKEILSDTYAEGLSPIIRAAAASGKLSGILNGIDLSYYSPQHDAVLAQNYTYRSYKRKAKNKLALQAELGLPQNADVPMLSMISRLTGQKGVDLIAAVMEEMLGDGFQLVVLGTGDPRYEDYFRYLEGKYPGQVRACIRFDKDLSKRIYAASDIFLMPSKTEPCGLSQMIAARYGTIPVVRETGGLYDSIKPYVEHDDGAFDGNGFTFAAYNAHDMMYTIRLALSLYRDPEKWGKLVVRAMRSDFSWDRSAKDYSALYGDA